MNADFWVFSERPIRILHQSTQPIESTESAVVRLKSLMLQTAGANSGQFIEFDSAGQKPAVRINLSELGE